MTTEEMDTLLGAVKFDDNGLVTAIAQDHASGDVMMVAYMNLDTLRRTLETNVMTYWSRSRQKVWIKGEQSGNTQRVLRVRIDCDGDALLFGIEQIGGAACHTGRRSCFYRDLGGSDWVVNSEPLFDPNAVYGK